jgi:hypothetical protein
VVICGEFWGSFGFVRLSAEIFGNWKMTEAKIDWRKRGETMVKRGENVVAPAISQGTAADHRSTLRELRVRFPAR